MSKALEELPESNLGHLVGGQAAAESVGDGGGDGAGDGGLDLASEGRNEDRTNYPAKDVLGVSIKIAVIRMLLTENVVFHTCLSQLARVSLSAGRSQPCNFQL